MTEEPKTATDLEKEKFFLHLAKQSGKFIRMDFSWCYGGYGAKIIPHKYNPYGWQVIFDPPEPDDNTEVKDIELAKQLALALAEEVSFIGRDASTNSLKLLSLAREELDLAEEFDEIGEFRMTE